MSWALDRNAPTTKIQQAQAHVATVETLLIKAQTDLNTTALQAKRIKALLTKKINMGIGLRNETLALEVRDAATRMIQLQLTTLSLFVRSTKSALGMLSIHTYNFPL